MFYDPVAQSDSMFFFTKLINGFWLNFTLTFALKIADQFNLRQTDSDSEY
jgi:hypothetical protein